MTAILAEVTAQTGSLWQIFVEAAVTVLVLMGIYALKVLASYFKVKAAGTKFDFVSQAAWSAVTGLEKKAEDIRSVNNGDIPAVEAQALREEAQREVVGWLKANGLAVGSAAAQEFLLPLIEAVVRQKKKVVQVNTAATNG